jgi:hypothetical protein
MGVFKEKSFCSNLAKNWLNSILLSKGFAFFMILDKPTAKRKKV